MPRLDSLLSFLTASVLRRALVVTLILFPLLTWVGRWLWGGPSIGAIITHSRFPLWLQVGWGLITASIAFESIRAMIKWSFFREVARHFLRMFLAVKMPVVDIIAASAGVAFAEELFFRGWLQQQIGILPAAIVFTGVHSYYYRKEVPRIFWIGLVLTAFSVILGLLYEYMGFVAAVSAHFFYNLFMFIYFRVEKGRHLRRLQQLRNLPFPPELKKVFHLMREKDDVTTL